MSRLDNWNRLREHAPVILPSLLLCDFGNLEREIARLESAGVRALHLDVMDGTFVPNLTYGMPIVSAIRRLTDMPLDVHLMIRQPSRYLEAFADAGADVITFHVEAEPDPAPLLRRIRALGLGAGVAVNPDTPLSLVEPHVSDCDLVLVMSVDAGFGGQAFNPVAIERLKALRAAGGDSLWLQVDGGINPSTIGECSAAGADLFVVGSAIFRQTDYGEAVHSLRQRAMDAASHATTAAGDGAPSRSAFRRSGETP
jgi:ribulose-phosphate 3-epimerase